jgi:hypothetical protein
MSDIDPEVPVHDVSTEGDDGDHGGVPPDLLELHELIELRDAQEAKPDA